MNQLLNLHVTIFSGLCDSWGTSEHHGGDTFTNSSCWNTICQRPGKYVLILILKINWQSSDHIQRQIIVINNRIKSIYKLPASIERFIEAHAFLRSNDLVPRPPPPPFPVSKLPLLLSLPVCRRSNLLTAEGVG